MTQSKTKSSGTKKTKSNKKTAKKKPAKTSVKKPAKKKTPAKSKVTASEKKKAKKTPPPVPSPTSAGPSIPPPVPKPRSKDDANNSTEKKAEKEPKQQPDADTTQEIDLPEDFTLEEDDSPFEEIELEESEEISISLELSDLEEDKAPPSSTKKEVPLASPKQADRTISLKKPSFLERMRELKKPVVKKPSPTKAPSQQSDSFEFSLEDLRDSTPPDAQTQTDKKSDDFTFRPAALQDASVSSSQKAKTNEQQASKDESDSSHSFAEEISFTAAMFQDSDSQDISSSEIQELDDDDFDFALESAPPEPAAPAPTSEKESSFEIPQLGTPSKVTPKKSQEETSFPDIPPALPPQVPKYSEKAKQPAALVEMAQRILSLQKEKPFKGLDADAVPWANALVDACKTELKLSDDKLRSARIHFEIAQAYELILDNAGLALKHYQKSIELAPQFLPGIRGAKRLLIAQKSYADAIGLFDSEIRITGSPKHKAALHLSKGRVFEDLLHQQRKAHQSYIKAVAVESSRPEILEALKQAELKAKNWQDLAQAYEKAANAVTEDPTYRASLTAHRARVFDTHLKETSRATEAYLTAMQLDADSSGALPALKRLLYAQDRWKELVELMEQEATEQQEVERKTATHIQIGQIYSERLGEIDKSILAFENAIELSPNDAFALKELCRHYETQGDTKKLIDALTRLIGAIQSPVERLGYQYRLGQLYEQELKDTKTAISWYEAALRISPSYIPALRALGQLYAQNQQWEALISMHIAESEKTSDTLRRADAYVRIAEIKEHHLEDSVEAANYHARALALCPTLESSFKALTRIYANSRQYTLLIELYEHAADQATDVDLLFAYLFKIGDLYEDALSRPESAVQVYQRILKRAPTNLGAIHALQRAADSAGLYRELVDGLKREADLSKDKARTIGLLQRAGEILDEKLDDVESALVYYGKVLDLDSDYAPALSGTGRLYHRTGRWSDLLEIYNRELKITELNEAKVTLLAKMGDLSAQQIGNVNDAIKYYRRAVEIDPNYSPALQFLYHLLRVKGQHDVLIEVMQTELSGVDSPNARARILCQIAEVHEIYTKDLPSAASAYEEAITSLPNFQTAQDGLLRVNAALGRWKELAKQLVADAEKTNERRIAADALLQAGTIYCDQLGDTSKAIDTFEKILDYQSMHVGAFLSLIPLYRERSSWRRLGQLYLRLSESLQDRREKVAVLGELARLIDIHRPELEVGITDALKAIVALDPSNIIALTALEDKAIASKDFELLAEVDAHLIQSMDESRVAALYLARLGQSIESSDPALSMEACSTALSIAPESLSAIRALERLAEKTASISDMVQSLRREAEWTKDGKTAADLFVKSAVIHLEQMDDFEGAVANLSAALERFPEHDDAAYRLSELLTQAGQIDLLINILSRTANMATDGKRKAQLLEAVSSLYADAKGDLSGAISAVSRMLKAQPDNIPTMMRLNELYKLNNQWDEAVTILELVVQLQPKGRVLKDAHMEIARINEKQLKKPRRALQQVETLLKMAPDHVEALSMQCDLQYKNHKYDAANQSAERLLKKTQDPAARALALVCIGRIKLKKGTKKQAAKMFREAVSLSGPNSPAAKDYKRLVGTEEPWAKYAEALMAYREQIQFLPDEKDNMITTFRELARVQHEGLGQANNAIKTLKQGISALGEHALLKTDLGLRLAATENYKDASREFRELLKDNPTNADIWRAMARTMKMQGRHGMYSHTLAPLVVLEQATPAERQESEQVLSRPGLAENASFDDSTMWRISPNVNGERAMTKLLVALNDALAKLYPPDLQQYGLTKGDSINSESNHPLRLIADTLSGVFNVSSFELYISPSGNDTSQVELTQPVSVILPAHVTNLSVSGQVFILARVFAYMARGHQAILKLGHQEMMRLLAAAAIKFSTHPFVEDIDQSTLEQLNKRLIKATSWMSRKNVEEAAQRFSHTSDVDLNVCLQSAEAAATRAAALLSSHLPTSVEVYRRLNPEIAEFTGEALVQYSPIVRDLLTFWASDLSESIRQKAGLL